MGVVFYWGREGLRMKSLHCLHLHCRHHTLSSDLINSWTAHTAKIATHPYKLIASRSRYDPNRVPLMHTRAHDRFGRIDILINNASALWWHVSEWVSEWVDRDMWVSWVLIIWESVSALPGRVFLSCTYCMQSQTSFWASLFIYATPKRTYIQHTTHTHLRNHTANTHLPRTYATLRWKNMISSPASTPGSDAEFVLMVTFKSMHLCANELGVEDLCINACMQ